MLGVKKQKKLCKIIGFRTICPSWSQTDHQAGRSPGINVDLWAFDDVKWRFNDV